MITATLIVAIAIVIVIRTIKMATRVLMIMTKKQSTDNKIKYCQQKC